MMYPRVLNRTTLEWYWINLSVLTSLVGLSYILIDSNLTPNWHIPYHLSTFRPPYFGFLALAIGVLSIVLIISRKWIVVTVFMLSLIWGYIAVTTFMDMITPSDSLPSTLLLFALSFTQCIGLWLTTRFFSKGSDYIRRKTKED